MSDIGNPEATSGPAFLKIEPQTFCFPTPPHVTITFPNVSGFLLSHEDYKDFKVMLEEWRLRRLLRTNPGEGAKP